MLKPRTVITYGTFDLFHIGHLRLLKRAKQHGDKLIVFVSTDEFNAEKGKSSIFPYEHRAEIIEACQYVDEVYPETSWEQKIDNIKEYNVNTFIIGDDWKGKFDFLKPYCNVIYLPRTEGISSTNLKQVISLLNTIKNSME